MGLGFRSFQKQNRNADSGVTKISLLTNKIPQIKTLGSSTSFKCTNPCPSTNKHPNQTLKTLFKVIALKIPGGQAPNLRPERADAASRLRSLSERQGSLMQLLQHMKEKQPNKCVKQNSMLKCSMSMVSLSTLGSRL